MEFSARSIRQGCRSTLKNLLYLRSYVTGPATIRTQELTFNGFNKNWQMDLDETRWHYHHPRLMVIGGRFVRACTEELDHYSIKTHYEGLRDYLQNGPQPKKVLEVGAGFGRTIFPLSKLFPQAEFHGIEYTETGPPTARLYEQALSAEIDAVARSVGPVAAKEPLVADFRTGDGKNLPFPDKSFDASYTNLVLEQIPAEEDHLRVLAEMRRVTRDVCGFLEPWKEAQNLLTMSYLRYIDYFRQSYQKLTELGFRNVRFQRLHYHPNLKYRYGYVVAEPDE